MGDNTPSSLGIDSHGKNRNTDFIKDNRQSPCEGNAHSSSNLFEDTEKMLQENQLIEKSLTERLREYERRRMATTRQIEEMNMKVVKQANEVQNLEEMVKRINERKIELSRRDFVEPALVTRLENFQHIRNIMAEQCEYYSNREVNQDVPLLKELKDNVNKLDGLLKERENITKNIDMRREFASVKERYEGNDGYFLERTSEARIEHASVVSKMEFYASEMSKFKNEMNEMTAEQREINEKLEEIKLNKEGNEQQQLVRKKKDELMAMINECNADIEELSAKRVANVKWHKKQIKEKRYKMEKLKAELEELTKDNLRLEAVNEKLGGDVEVVTTEIENSKSLLENLTSELTEISAMKKKLEQELEYEEESLAECERTKLQELNCQREELKREDEKLEEMKIYAQEIEKKIGQLKMSQLELDVEMDKNYALSNSLVNELSALMTRKKEMKAEMEQLASENERLEESLRVKRCSRAEQEERMKLEIQQLEGVKGQVLTELVSAIQENSEVRQLLDEADLQISASAKILDRLLKENSEQASRLCLKGEQMAEAEANVQNLEEKKKELEIRAKTMRDQNNKLRTRRQHSVERRMERQTVLENLLRQIDRECAHLKEKLNKSICERKRLLKQIDEGRKYIKELEIRLNWVNSVSSVTGK